MPTPDSANGQDPAATQQDPADGQDPQATGSEQTTDQQDSAGQEPEMFPREVVEQLRRENAARRTREAELAAQIKEFKDSTKSESEKLEERAAAAESSKAELETEVGSLRTQLLRYEIAAAKGLDLKHAHRLAGQSREEMEADADELAQLVRPRDDLDGGARGRAPANAGGDMNDLLRRAAGRA